MSNQPITGSTGVRSEGPSDAQSNVDFSNQEPTDFFRVGDHVFHSRLILGSGKYSSFEVMKESLEVSGSQCVTIAVRRERLHDSSGRNILDFVDSEKFILLPNTA